MTESIPCLLRHDQTGGESPLGHPQSEAMTKTLVWAEMDVEALRARKQSVKERHNLFMIASAFI
jgi:hypothetical protein